jgi:hypothetical protein
MRYGFRKCSRSIRIPGRYARRIGDIKYCSSEVEEQ